MCRLIGQISASLIAIGVLDPAMAQKTSPGDVRVMTPIEITAETINGNLRCRPPRARLPAQEGIELRVVNNSKRPVAFAAPKFFNASTVIESGGFTWDIVQDRFLVAPRSTVWVRLQSPIPGEYYYSCFEQGKVPTDSTSGFLTVVPAAN